MEEKGFDIVKVAAYAVAIFCGGSVLLFLFRELFPILLPFVLGFFAAFPIRFLAERLHHYTKIPYKVASVILVFAFLFGAGGLLFWLAARLFGEMMRLFTYLSEHPELTSGLLGRIEGFFESRFAFLSDIFGEGDTLTGLFGSLLEKGIGFASGALGTLLRSLPSALFAFAVTVIAAVYFSMDLSKINEGVRSVLPPAWHKGLQRAKVGALKTAVSYLRSFATIFLLNFVLLFLGLTVLSQEYALLLAFLFAVLDLLPIIGIGISLVPWGIYSLATGNLVLGAGLLILYASLTLLRQFLEPRLVGKGIGLHPLVTLCSMVLGGAFLGIFGLLFGPLLAVGVKGMLTAKKEA